MDNKIFYSFFAALVSLCIFSCTDDEAPNPIQDLSNISSNTWKIESIETHQSVEYTIIGQKYSVDTTMNVTEGLEKCKYDVAYQFKENQQLIYTASETFCGEPMTGDYTWKLSEDKTQIILYGEDGMVFLGSSSGLTVLSNELTMDIIEVNEQIMRLKYVLPYEEFLQNIEGIDGFSLQMIEEMGIEMKGSTEVDFVFVKAMG